MLVQITNAMVEDEQLVRDFLKTRSMMSKLFAYPKILSPADQGLLLEFGYWVPQSNIKIKLINNFYNYKFNTDLANLEIKTT